MQIIATKHAGKRMRQRGIRNEQVLAVAQLADIDVPVGRSLHAMRMSRHAIAEAAAEGLSASEFDRLRHMVLVESADGALVTVAHLHGRKSRAYSRRDRRKFWRS